jgi:hypothetical protein
MRSRDCQKEVRQPIAWMLIISQKKQRHQGILCDVFHLLVEQPDRADLPAVDRETLLQPPRLSLRPLPSIQCATNWIVPPPRAICGGSNKSSSATSDNGGYLHFHERAETAIWKRAISRRVRYLIDGGVFGSAAFVENVFARHRERFGLKRKTGARRMREADW